MLEKNFITFARQKNVILVFAAGNDNVLASANPQNRFVNATVNVAAVIRVSGVPLLLIMGWEPMYPLLVKPFIALGQAVMVSRWKMEPAWLLLSFLALLL